MPYALLLVLQELPIWAVMVRAPVSTAVVAVAVTSVAVAVVARLRGFHKTAAAVVALDL